MARTRTLIALGSAVTVGVAYRWRKHPSACPYNQRFWVQAPHPGITRKRMVKALEPRPGERILEVGPGTGYYSFDIAERLGEGRLEIFDIQQEMLDHVMQQAERRGVTNVSPTRGDAQALPFEDASFDGAVLVTVLGEIPDQELALRQIARVLRPGGRLVVGEMFGDPHMVTPGKLTERAVRAGFQPEQRLGSPLAFFARFRR